MGSEVKENAKTFCLYHLFDLCRIIQHAQKVEGERQVSVNSFARGDSHVTFHRCYFHVFSLRTSTWSCFIASLFVSLLKLIWVWFLWLTDTLKDTNAYIKSTWIDWLWYWQFFGEQTVMDNRVDFSRKKWRPEKAVCIRAFCNKTALNMNFLSNETHTVLWPFIPLDKAGSAQTYSNIVWLLHLKRCFLFHCFKIKRTADVFYCYPSSRQRKGIKYEENKINLVKFSFLREVLLLCYSQLNQPFPYIGRVYVPYLRRSCHCTCSCKQRDVAVCSTIILRPWVLNGSRRLNPRSPCYISSSFL